MSIHAAGHSQNGLRQFVRHKVVETANEIRLRAWQSERDRTRLKSEVKRKGISLVEFARKELLGVLISCGQI